LEERDLVSIGGSISTGVEAGFGIKVCRF